MPGGLQQHELPSHVLQDAHPVESTPAATATNDEKAVEGLDGYATDDAADAGSLAIGKHEHERPVDACLDVDARQIGGRANAGKQHDAVEIGPTR